MTDLLWGILLDDCAWRNRETLKHLADESKTSLRISNLYVDDCAAHARAASGDLAEAGLLQSLLEWILDLVAASEGEVCGLQDDLEECRVTHGGGFLASVYRMRVATPNGRKLSDRRSGRGLCRLVERWRRSEAQAVTVEPVR
jgi:ribosomal protein L34